MVLQTIKEFHLVGLVILYLSTKTNAANLNCGDKSVVECKKAFVDLMENRFHDIYMRSMLSEIAGIIDVFEGVVSDLPADDKNAKLFKNSLDELINDCQAFRKYENDYTKLREITHHFELHMQPHITLVGPNEKPSAELEKLLAKHNYTQTLEKFDANEFVEHVTGTWTEAYEGLRDIDLKEYPAYNDINDTVKRLAVEKDEKKQTKLFREVVLKIRNFLKVPFFEELLFYSKNETNKL